MRAIMNKIISFGKSIKKYVENGSPEVSDFTYFDRIKICRDCEHFNQILTKCKECGCFLNIKARWATEKCPLDKWSAEIATEQNQEQSPHQTQNSSQKPGGCACNK